MPPPKAHPHEAAVQKAAAAFRRLDTLKEGWVDLPSQPGVASAKLNIEGTPTGCIRGEGLIPGYAPPFVLATILSFEARVKCTKHVHVVCR